MNLNKKKELAAKALKVGKNRIIFSGEGLSEIKEAITKEDIKTLYSEGLISIKPIKGRKKLKKRKTKRGPGKIKKKVNKRKQTYVKLTRKLRGYLKNLADRKIVDKELYYELRRRIRMRAFKSKANFKEYLTSLEIFDEDKIEGKKPQKKTANKASKKKKSTKKITKEKKNETRQKKTKRE